MQVDDLSCELDGRTLLAGVSLAVEPGEPLALLGPSGAGKSLLLRCLLGLAPAAARVRGTLQWDGRRTGLDDRRALASLRGRGLTLVPQAAAASLDPVRTIGAQLEELRSLHSNTTSVAALLAEVGLGPAFAARHPHALSGGQAQRAALALALACGPRVLLADEPTASLDSAAQAEIVALLSSRCGEREIGLVLACHDLAVAARCCSRALVLDGGRAVESGALADLLAAPAHATTEALVLAARRADALRESMRPGVSV